MQLGKGIIVELTGLLQVLDRWYFFNAWRKMFGVRLWRRHLSMRFVLWRRRRNVTVCYQLVIVLHTSWVKTNESLLLLKWWRQLSDCSAVLDVQSHYFVFTIAKPIRYWKQRNLSICRFLLYPDSGICMDVEKLLGCMIWSFNIAKV